MFLYYLHLHTSYTFGCCSLTYIDITFVLRLGTNQHLQFCVAVVAQDLNPVLPFGLGKAKSFFLNFMNKLLLISLLLPSIYSVLRSFEVGKLSEAPY